MLPHENLKIVSVKDLLEVNLTIPKYQRPYKWTTESALTLFNDIHASFTSNIPEYRIGSVVLHLENATDRYNIVDGQQRLTTISILAYCLNQIIDGSKYKDVSKLLVAENIFNKLSSEAIVNNYMILKKKCSDLPNDKKEKFIGYVLNNCTFVKIITNSEQEAFQFFDSQNSRGKTLAPHDLLKSYHLREMNDDSENIKIPIINQWQNINQKSLALFFENNLYPLVKYFKNENGLSYSSKKIKVFKGINQKNTYHFSVYHKAANLYIEHFNSEGMYELSSGDLINQFQLTQPLIAGKRFFQYTLHYYDLYQKTINIIESNFTEDEISTNGSGNRYIRNLFINILIFFIDKFNLESLNHHQLELLYKWCYSLRVVMYSVYPETVNNYARGQHERVNFGLNMFSKIAEIQSPQELDSIILETISKEQLNSFKATTYLNIWNKIFGEQK